MGNSKGGGLGNAGAPESAEARRLALLQGNIAQDIFQQSAPLRTESFGLLNQELDRVGQPINMEALAQNPQFGALKAATEQQFDLARDRTLEALPRGGVLQDALGEVERGRAGALTAGFGALAGDEMQARERNLDRALGISTAIPGISLGGLSSAGGTFSNLAGQEASIAAAQQAAEAQKSGGLGQGVGSVLGSVFSGAGTAGKAGDAIGMAAGDGGGDKAGGAGTGGGGGGLSAPPGTGSLLSSLFGGGGAAGGAVAGAGGAGTVAGNLAGFAGQAGPAGGFGGTAAASGASPGLLSGGLGTALGAAAPLALVAFGMSRSNARKEQEAAAFAPFWQQVQSTPRTTVQVPGKGAVSGRPFVDPSDGEQYIMHGNDDLGTGRSMGVIRLRDGAEGLWRPLGGGVQFVGDEIYGGGNFLENKALAAIARRDAALMEQGA